MKKNTYPSIIETQPEYVAYLQTFLRLIMFHGVLVKVLTVHARPELLYYTFTYGYFFKLNYNIIIQTVKYNRKLNIF